MKVNGVFASTFLRGKADLRVKELRPLGGHEQGDTGAGSSGLGWNIQKQQQRWRLMQVLERCCRGSSRGETDNLDLSQAPYIPKDVGRTTI